MWLRFSVGRISVSDEKLEAALDPLGKGLSWIGHVSSDVTPPLSSPSPLIIESFQPPSQH